MKFLSLPTIAVAALSMFVITAGPARSATTTCSVAGPGGTDYSLSDSTAAECFSGNDTNTIDASFSMFGLTGWILSDKNDDMTSGDQTIVFTNAPVNGVQSGDWEINTLAGLSSIVITLKAGNGFGAFLLDLAGLDPLSGMWSSGKDLSHASIYYNGTPSPVPLPAGIWLFLTGVGSLGLIARRKRRISST